MKKQSDNFDPRIVVFACNWCSYAGADTAGVSRMQYPPNVRLIRVMCSGSGSEMFFRHKTSDEYSDHIRPAQMSNLGNN